jgi:protein arginine kinase activator
MKCQNCDEKATVHFTQLEDGNMNKVSYCEACAALEGITDLASFGLGDVVIPEASPSDGVGDGVSNSEQCPQCGFTKQKFQQTGRLGCSQCYLTFADEILSRLGTMHRGLRHLGKRPEDYTDNPYAETLLEESRERLEEAVTNENYEQAAKIRDEIQRLEEGLAKAEASSTQPGGEES